MGFSLHPIMLTAATTIAAFAQLPGYAVARAGVQQQEYGLRQLRGAGAHDGPLASGGGTITRTSAALWIEAREGNIGSGEGPLRKLLQGCQHQEYAPGHCSSLCGSSSCGGDVSPQLSHKSLHGRRTPGLGPGQMLPCMYADACVCAALLRVNTCDTVGA